MIGVLYPIDVCLMSVSCLNIVLCESVVEISGSMLGSYGLNVQEFDFYGIVIYCSRV